MHSTHHNQFKVSSYIYAQKKKRGRAVTILQQWKWKPTSSEDYQKSDLVAAPNIQTSCGSQTRLNWPRFHECAPFSTGSGFTFLRNLILIINPSIKMEGEKNMISCLSQPTQPFLHPTVQMVTQIHWKLPWSHNSTSRLQTLGIREDYTGGGEGAGMHIPSVCLLSSCSTLSFHYEPLLRCLS